MEGCWESTTRCSMSNLQAHQLSKIIHIHSPSECIIMGPEVPAQLVPLSPCLSSVLRSTMITLVRKGKWSKRASWESADTYVYERRE